MKYITLLFIIGMSTNVYAVYDPDPSSVPATATGSNELKIRLSGQPAPKRGDPKIRINCTFAKAGKFDPIIAPGKPSAHHHTFFGNTGVSPNSAGRSLIDSGGSTCMGGSLIRSSAWVPSMLDSRGNKFITPKGALVYYQTFVYGSVLTSKAHQYVKQMPHGLKILSESSAPAYDNYPGYLYMCTDPSGKVLSTANNKIPVCNSTGTLFYSISFWPECWDGKNLDSPDHKSHMAFKFSGDWRKNPNECPSTHPVRVPQIHLNVYYKVNVPGETRYWRLASDSSRDIPGSTLHADYMGGVDRGIQEIYIQNCIRSKNDCGMGKLGAVFNRGVSSKLYELY